jgi:hypothetical protein
MQRDGKTPGNSWPLISALIFVFGILASAGTAKGQTFTSSELPPPDLQSDGFYGWSVALSQDGNTALVGAQGQGRAYVFIRAGGLWTLDSRLPPDFPKSRAFGFSVALSADGTVALVSNPDEPCPSPVSVPCGAAFVFVRHGGTWVQEARFGPNAAFDFFGNFGFSVALSADGSTAIVGQLLANCPGGICRGQASVFHRDAGGTWNPEGDLVASNPNVQSFGASVALSSDGNTALIGGPGTVCPVGFGCGAAYVFTRSGGVWSQQMELTASDPQQGGFFGTSVGLAADGTSALIGAPGDSSEFDLRMGAVYAFAQSGGVWTQQQKISGGGNGDGFGLDLGLSPNGQAALVGASGTDCTSGNDNCGAVYRLSRQGGSWIPPQRLLDFDPGDLGGFAVALSSDGRAGLVGAPGTACAAGTSCGTAYVLSFLLAEPGIPTASHLGLASLTLLLAMSGAWVLARRRRSA